MLLESVPAGTQTTPQKTVPGDSPGRCSNGGSAGLIMNTQLITFFILAIIAIAAALGMLFSRRCGLFGFFSC